MRKLTSSSGIDFGNFGTTWKCRTVASYILMQLTFIILRLYSSLHSVYFLLKSSSSFFNFKYLILFVFMYNILDYCYH